MKRDHKKLRLPYEDLNKYAKIEIVDGMEIPVKRIKICSSHTSKKGFELFAHFYFNLVDMKDYKKALYINEKDGIEISVIECRNFEIAQAWTTNYINKYDVETIKYDDRFDYKGPKGSGYDPGPKGDRLNSMNRTWYEND